MGEQQQDRGSVIRLSGRQQTAVAAALTIVAALVILCTLFGLAWVLVLFGRRFSHVFLPLAVGGIAALVFRPYYAWLHERLRLPIPLALTAVFVSVRTQRPAVSDGPGRTDARRAARDPLRQQRARLRDGAVPRPQGTDVAVRREDERSQVS